MFKTQNNSKSKTQHNVSNSCHMAGYRVCVWLLGDDDNDYDGNDDNYDDDDNDGLPANSHPPKFHHVADIVGNWSVVIRVGKRDGEEDDMHSVVL